MPPSLTIAAGGEERACLGGSPGGRLPVFAPGEILARMFFIYISRNVKKNKICIGIILYCAGTHPSRPVIGRWKFCS
jgi:hypothetical protein